MRSRVSAGDRPKANETENREIRKKPFDLFNNVLLYPSQHEVSESN